MKHVAVVGVCYLDTILDVSHYPEEDSKLRASKVQVRRGGNGGNTLHVLQQLLRQRRATTTTTETRDDDDEDVRPHLLTPLPAATSPATAQVLASFGPDPLVDFGLCWHREGETQMPASYIVRSAATSSRTIVNHNPLPEMTTADFAGALDAFVASSLTKTTDEEAAGAGCWWHFEGRIPDTTLECIRLLRRRLPSATISVEVEKPGREGLVELAAEADVVFYSRTWAQAHGYRGPEECLRGEAPTHASCIFVTWGAEGASALSLQSQEYHHCAVKDEVREGEIHVVDTIGAGDTFVAGVIFGLVCHPGDWDLQQTLRFAVRLASQKVTIDGFDGLRADEN